jgi:hypothetical protein
MRVFIGMMEIAGYYSNLKKGLRELGIDTVFVDLEAHPFQYMGHDVPNPLVRLTTYVSGKRAHTPRSPKLNLLIKTFWKSLELPLRLLLMIWAVAKYDVFIFAGAGKSFFYFHDLILLRMLNKKIIFVFNGSDARPPYINGAVMASDRGYTIEQCIQLTKKRKKALKKIERYADVLVSHPHHGQFHEVPFVHFTMVGFPFAAPIPPASTHSPTEIVHILHSPSHPEGKGTYVIRRAIDNLKARGYKIDFLEITKRPHAEVMQNLVKCDFVVDQVYSDIFISGFGTEAAAMGKAVIIGGYGLETSKQEFPPAYFPPVYLCHPDQIEVAIETLIMNSSFRTHLGTQAAEFVRINYAPSKVAEHFLRLIQGDIPQEWICDPYEVRYLHGYGLSEEKVKNILREFIQKGGRDSLQLQDKPVLEKSFVDFAFSTSPSA